MNKSNLLLAALALFAVLWALYFGAGLL